MVQSKDWGEMALSTAKATSCVVKSESSLTPDHTNSKKFDVGEDLKPKQLSDSTDIKTCQNLLKNESK